MRTLSVLLVVACAGHSPPEAVIPDTPAPPPPLRVAVLGDRSGEPDDVVWRDVVSQVARMHPDLVLTVGDLADDADDEADWGRAMAPLSVFDELGIEVQHTPGNHDIHDATSAERFQRLTGQAPYRSFDRGGVHWVVVDNSIASDAGTLPEEQLAWLDRDLGDNALPTVVLMHKPFWADAVAAGKPDPLHRRFVDHGVLAVITGHWHRHAHQRIDGIDYVLVGSSGGGTSGIPSVDLGTTPEFLWITVDDGLHLATMGEGGPRPVELPSLRDERRLHDVQWYGALRAVLSADGDSVHLERPTDDDATGVLEVTGTVPGSEPMVLQALGADASRSQSVSVAPGLPLPRVTVTLDLPDSGPTEVVLVPDWPREASAHRVDAPPSVDGDLAEWTRAPTVTEWTDIRGRASLADPTRLWLAYDDDALYLAARCDDPNPGGIERLHGGRDGQVVYDDRIGVQLATAPDQVFWAYLSAAGSVWDVHIDRAEHVAHWDWDAVEAAAATDDAGWAVEASIPWSALGLEVAPTSLGFDARRKQEGRQVEATFTPAFFTSDPARMGTLILD